MSIILKILAVLILIYYGLLFLLRLLAPFLAKKIVSQIKRGMTKSYKNTQQPDVNEGETIIDKKPKLSRQSDNSVGEYIDFEEIE